MLFECFMKKKISSDNKISLNILIILFNLIIGFKIKFNNYLSTNNSYSKILNKNIYYLVDYYYQSLKALI